MQLFSSAIPFCPASPFSPLTLNDELLQSPTYSDQAVETGQTYRYAISAVDLEGNESELSEKRVTADLQ